jgi:N-acetylglucosamine kinase-like BadF-type ATPase
VNQSYVDTIEKVQAQGLEALKQAQAAQSAAVNSFRELITNATSKLPGAEALRNIPTIVSQVSELNSAFAVKLIEQQNEYVSQLVKVLKSAQTEPATTTEGVAEKA